MPPIKDSHNSDTVSNKQRSLSAIQAPVDPPQRHINPRAAEGILVSIKHPLAKHQVSGMLFWLEEAREEDCWFLFFSFFPPFFLKERMSPEEPCWQLELKSYTPENKNRTKEK